MSLKTLMGAGLAMCGLGGALFLLSRPAVQRALWLSPPLRPVLMQGFQNASDSDEHAKYFFFLVRRQEYAGARQLLTPAAQKLLPLSSFQAKWLAFQKAHGRVTRWTLTGEKSSLLPTFVDKVYLVSGSRGTSERVTLQMIQIKGSWQVDRLAVAN